MSAPVASKYISSELASNTIIESLGLDTKDRGQILRWMYEAATTELEMPAAFEQEEILIDIVDCEAKKPCDYVWTNQAYVDTGSECVAPYWVDMRSSKKTRRMNGKQYTARDRGKYGIEERSNSFILSSNANGKKLSLNYTKYKFDENGMIVIDQIYLPALEAYVRYKHVVKQRNISPRSYNVGDADRAWQEFGYRRRSARGKLAKRILTKDMENQIAAKWNDIYYTTLNQWSRNVQATNYATHSSYLAGIVSGYYDGGGEYNASV